MKAGEDARVVGDAAEARRVRELLRMRGVDVNAKQQSLVTRNKLTGSLRGAATAADSDAVSRDK